MTNSHVPLLREEDELETADGARVKVWELHHVDADEAVWNDWARHFRGHYCADKLIDILKKDTPHESSRAEYLNNLVFPDAGSNLGPAVRAGDFAEILVADLIEHKLAYWVPRTRYAAKQVRDESVKGVDIIGMKFTAADYSATVTDELMTVETKAQLSGIKLKPRLQDAIVDSIKDEFRKGETLNAMKWRLIEQDRVDEANRVGRFQDSLRNPYVQKIGAAAVFCNSIYDGAALAKVTNLGVHPHSGDVTLMVIRADNFMNVVNTLYKRAADEA